MRLLLCGVLCALPLLPSTGCSGEGVTTAEDRVLPPPPEVQSRLPLHPVKPPRHKATRMDWAPGAD
jgi:hypothetical protein